jgi:hypothetical protein
VSDKGRLDLSIGARNPSLPGDSTRQQRATQPSVKCLQPMMELHSVVGVLGGFGRSRGGFSRALWRGGYQGPTGPNRADNPPDPRMGRTARITGVAPPSGHLPAGLTGEDHERRAAILTSASGDGSESPNLAGIMPDANPRGAGPDLQAVAAFVCLKGGRSGPKPTHICVREPSSGARRPPDRGQIVANFRTRTTPSGICHVREPASGDSGSAGTPSRGPRPCPESEDSGKVRQPHLAELPAPRIRSIGARAATRRPGQSRLSTARPSAATWPGRSSR